MWALDLLKGGTRKLRQALRQQVSQLEQDADAHREETGIKQRSVSHSTSELRRRKGRRRRTTKAAQRQQQQL